MGFLVNLNYLYFAILTTLGLMFVLGKSVAVKNPLHREQRIRLDGTEAFWILTFSTGLLALNVSGLIDLMAIRLFVIEILCIIAIFRSNHSPVMSGAIWLYLFYIIWIIIGCTYSSSPNYGLRVILKYLFPLLITLTASTAVRNHEIFVKACIGALVFGLLALIFNFVPYISALAPGVWWYVTAEAIHFISLMVLCLAFSFFTTAKTKFQIFAFLFILPCFIWVFRTSILGSFVALSAFFFIRYRFKSLPIIFSLFIIGVVAVFTIPNLHNKMFTDESNKVSIEEFQEGKVGQEDIRYNSRDVMWEHLLGKFYTGHTIIGSGTGSVQQYMYTTHIFGGLKVPHNDYVQMLCDNGIVSLILYISIALFIFFHCFTVYHRSSVVPIKICALTAGASIIGVGITLNYENVVNYSMTTLSMPYGFYGMMLGLLQKQNGKI